MCIKFSCEVAYMLLVERLEDSERGKRLNLARNIAGDEVDFNRTFNTLGYSAKDCYAVIKQGARILKENRVKEIYLPFTSASHYFVDVLNHLQGEEDYLCHVVLIIPGNYDAESVDRTLYDDFKRISNITIEVRQLVISYTAVTEEALAPATDRHLKMS